MLTNVDLNGPGSAAYSPSGSDPAQDTSNPMVLATRATMRTPANGPPGMLDGYVDDRNGLRPPDPSTGGRTGVSDQLGWTTGLSASRNRHQHLTGATLVVRNMGAHPNVGPVGFSTRSQRAYNGVTALGTDYTPTTAQVAASFLQGGL